jgi:hypothetical protein
MGLFSLFPNRDIARFAKELADSLAKRYPPTLDISPEKRVSEARLTRVLEETLTRATDFQREHKLGMFGKAKLGNEFKWQLKELGYTEKFVDLATEGLMVYVTRGAAVSGSPPDAKNR